MLQTATTQTPAQPHRVVCAWCQDFNPDDPGNAVVSHGICPPCREKHFGADSRAVDRRRAALEAMLSPAWAYVQASESGPVPSLEVLSDSQCDHARAVLLSALMRPETIRAFLRVVGR